MLVLITPNSASSRSVMSEIALALARDSGELPTFPVLRGSPDIVPHLLRSRVYVDLSDGNDFEKSINVIAAGMLHAFEMPGSFQAEQANTASTRARGIELQRAVLQDFSLVNSREDEVRSSRISLYISLLGIVFGALGAVSRCYPLRNHVI